MTCLQGTQPLRLYSLHPPTFALGEVGGGGGGGGEREGERSLSKKSQFVSR